MKLGVVILIAGSLVLIADSHVLIGVRPLCGDTTTRALTDFTSYERQELVNLSTLRTLSCLAFIYGPTSLTLSR